MYNTFIFDLYGTLIDIHTDEESPEFWERLSYHFLYSGYPIKPEALKEQYREEVSRQFSNPAVKCEFPEIDVHLIFKTIASRKGQCPDVEWIEETVRWFRRLSIRRLQLYEGVKETLIILKAQNKKIYLLSNGQKTFVEEEMRALGIDDLFDGIAISSNPGICKPDPLFYDYLVNTFKVDLSSAIMIGNDATTDIEGAKRVGIDACYFHSNCSPNTTEVDCKYQIWDGNFRRILDMQ
ncbi:putative hydrolase of the HAD superfamily [Fontibacillus solani]|uniref:Putative hydrolase of the HAD superfamily n=1 Tax=Fontibacillus solani TaxID=1572857 RepID=A0A7W3SZ27_9BACL|nr:HAD family hydrolase [Fontibacillus solani]MBA9088845.1 putative hydrolase of the HAD superfamily [Fontibacillus solani]